MELLQRIWQENRTFLLITGSALAVFQLLNSCALETLIRSAGEERKRNQTVERSINTDRGKVLQGYPDEKKNLEDLGVIEKSLRARCLTPPPASVPDARRGAPQIQFSERIDRIWSEVREKANQKNVRIPEKISTADLGVTSGDTAEDHERNAAYLEILARALHACVDQGITQIDKVSILQETDLPVRENDTLVIYRRVGLQVQGPYSGYKGILREFQRQPGFIQVRLLSLDARGSQGTSALRGNLEFTGVYFYAESEGVEEKPEEVKPVKKPPRRPGRKPR